MKFVSLTDPADSVSFAQALASGVAQAGGLYVPESIPRLSNKAIDGLAGAGRQAVARALLTPWLRDEIPATELDLIIRRASSFETPVKHVGDKRVLELFHGPTMAFKDVAARYLAEFISYFNRQAGSTSTILVATSGDTGGAIAHGFGTVERVRVVVLYPKARVSRLQREQLRRVADNVWTLEVAGSFDDCQQLVKQALADTELAGSLRLTSANSISIGRLLPQMTYYAYAHGQLNDPALRFVVPSGNLGNLTGGVLARAMGVPMAGFLAANNMNDALYRYLQTGSYEPRATIPTLSNAMDIGAPNNLPRLTHLFGDNIATMRAEVLATRVSDEATVKTIKRVYADTGYLLDPHTAVAWQASEAAGSGAHDVIVATASPLKFAEEILAKTGIAVDNSREMEKLRTLPERYWQIGTSIDAFQTFLGEHVL